jgi:hypothetical protein
MAEDPRCCGSGTCIIDGEGRCWCGQQWNGHAMGPPPLMTPATLAPRDAEQGASDHAADGPGARP